MTESAPPRQIQIYDPIDDISKNVTGDAIDGNTCMHVATKLSSSRPGNFIYKFLREDNTAASADMNVNATSTSTRSFQYSPGAGKFACVNRLLILVLDTGIEPALFGGLTALTNGVKITCNDTDGSELIDFTDGDAINSNAEWVHLAGTDNPITDSGVGPGIDELAVRWTIGKAGSSLFLKETQSIRFEIRDDLSGLTEFRAMVQGVNGDL